MSLKTWLRNWLNIENYNYYSERLGEGFEFVALGGEDPELGTNPKVEAFGWRLGRTATIAVFVRGGEGANPGNGDAYSFALPARWQPDPYITPSVLGVGWMYNSRPSGFPSTRIVIARFHQEWFDVDRRFGIRLYTPVQFDEPDDRAKGGLVRPGYPMVFRSDDEIKFQITYWLSA